MKKKTFYFFIFLLCSLQSRAQDCTSGSAAIPFRGNNLKTYITNNGNLFYDYSGNKGLSFVPTDTGSLNSISLSNLLSLSALWLTAKDSTGNQLDASVNYGIKNSAMVSYYPGPSSPITGLPDLSKCKDFDKIWSVRDYEIRFFLSDYNDNNVINKPVPKNILGWPGRGNPYFEQVNGFSLPSQDLAPFFDRNSDGIYNPYSGDYPVLPSSIAAPTVIPSFMAWSVFNSSPYSFRPSNPISVEVQQTIWSFNCSDSLFAPINNTVFSSHRIINRNNQRIDSLYFGYFAHFDLACAQGDYAGCTPSLNSYFFYKKFGFTPADTNYCIGSAPFYKNKIPLISNTFLNQKLNKFMYFNDEQVGIFSTADYLKGQWSAIKPLTFGENGLNPNNSPTDFAFPGNPNDSTQWTMRSANLNILDQKTVGSCFKNKLNAGEMIELNSALQYHFDTTRTYQQLIDDMNLKITKIQNAYNQRFEVICNNPPPVCSGQDCVYPGDANNDGIVTNLDFLYVGVAQNKTGGTHKQPNIWEPKTADNWIYQFPNAVNGKHADCSGDGKVNFTDFTVTKENLGLTTLDYVPSVETQVISNQLTFVGVANNINFNKLSASTIFNAFVKVQNIDSLYGLTFSMELDTKIINDPTNVSKKAPWSDNLGFSYLPSTLNLSDSTRIFEYTWVRSDNQNAGVSNPTAKLINFTLIPRVKMFQQIASNIDTIVTFINFKNVKAILKDGTVIDTFGSKNVKLRFLRNPLLAPDLKNLDDDISIFPNPNRGKFSVESSISLISTIIITDCTGRFLFQTKQSAANEIQIDMSGFTNGLYFLEIWNEKQQRISVKKVIICD